MSKSHYYKRSSECISHTAQLEYETDKDLANPTKGIFDMDRQGVRGVLAT